MAYQDCIAYLYGLSQKGIKLGLKNTRALLRNLGNPQDYFSSIHIAGTNGKGSTSYMAETLLRGLGYITGLFTSPHMVRFTERIKVNAQEISEDDVVRLTEMIRAVQGNILPTFFEFVTAMAFYYFREKAVEWAVIETGMGGRFDATNVLRPAVSIITRVGFDHREFLGNTLREIAFEKAGITKEGTPVVVASQQKEALEVIESVARERRAPLYLYGRDFKGTLRDSTPEGILIDVFTTEKTFRDLFLPLVGRHQVVNASLAIQAVILATKRLDENTLRESLRELKIEGRMELKHFRGKTFLLDGAHNPEAIEALVSTIESLYLGNPYKRVIFIVATMADKDQPGILRPLLRVATMVVVTEVGYERSSSVDSLYSAVQKAGPEIPVLKASDMKEAIERATERAEEEDLIVITGSFYAVGEAKEVMGSSVVLKELRERL